MSRTKIISIAGAAVVIGLILVLAIRSGDESASPQNVDGAFLTQMVPHHEGAIEMAEIAKERAQHPEIVQLANEIVRTQTSEIQRLNEIHESVFNTSVSGSDQGDLGMDQSMMGMDMDMDALETARPFDREFIDQMIPHHQGAIRMARVQLRYGEDQETKDLATQIVDAQAREIEQMNAWRKAWYGETSPSGGVPDLDEMDMSAPVEGMDHSGH